MFLQACNAIVLSVVFAIAAVLGCCGKLTAQSDFNDAPILYESTEADDRVAKLAAELASGKVDLEWNDADGYLRDLLKHLKLDEDSQTLVFSKTSLQAPLITPSNPRALYFSDDVYMGYVPGGRIIELSAVDPVQGAVFYSLKQTEAKRPAINRDRTECMTCHGTSKTQDVPGYLVRSLYTTDSGQPNYSLGSTTTDHTTDFANRFGGWYVTGKHGSMRHRGNVFVDANQQTTELDAESGANRQRLPARVDTGNYPADSSDIVALMVLEHQTQMHNAITAASYEARRAAHYDRQMNELFERPEDQVSDSTKRRIKSAGDRLLRHLLFCDEAKLTAKVQGTSKFAERFEARGPFDSKGRSLRQFDLSTRMFKYPCSFLIYSESFSSLPKPMLDYVEQRLVKLLLGKDSAPEFAHLNVSDRESLLAILIETKPNIRELTKRLSGE